VLNDEGFTCLGVSNVDLARVICPGCLLGQVHRFAVLGLQIIMTIYQIVAAGLSAFGLGYAAGSIQRIIRRSIEILD
jgi:hypothetical protein